MIARETRRTVNEEVYFQMKKMIATGELASGTSLTLRPLAAKLGVSKMPVIEAIRRLERDGLVNTLAKWGATVKEWSREEVLEATYIRRGLEAEAARLFVERASKEDKQKLVELGERFDALAATDPMRCEEADMDLHLHVVRSTHYPRLYELVENSKIETTTSYGLQLARNDPPGGKGLIYQELVGVHKPVIEALLGTDPDAAAVAMWQHISGVLKHIIEVDPALERLHTDQAVIIALLPASALQLSFPTFGSHLDSRVVEEVQAASDSNPLLFRFV